MRYLALVAGLLTACSASQLQTATQDTAKVQAALNQGCAVYAQTAAIVNATPAGLTPQAQTIEAFGSGACVGGIATTALLDKALTDPATQAWLENLSVQLKAVKAKA